MSYRRDWVRFLGFVGASLVAACGSPNDTGNLDLSTAGAAGTSGALGTAGSNQGASGSTATGGQPGFGGSAGVVTAGSSGGGVAGVSGGGSSDGGAGAAAGGTAGSSGGGQAGAGGLATAGTGGNSNSAGNGNGGAGLGGGGAGGMPGTGGPLPTGVTSLFPAPGATGVCLDAPLTLTFSSTPSVGSSGKIAIFAKNNPNTAVDTVDVTTTKYTDTIGGQSRNLVRPVFIDGKQAVVYFHQHKLAANTTYYVTVSAGAFVDSGKAALGAVSSASAWSFTTGAAPSASASMSVNRTGNGGGFCTVQGAFDAIPANNTTARTITVAANIYHEVLYLSAKKNLSLVGTDRANTVIEYPNNDKLNAGTSARPMFSVKGADNLSISTLTLYNTTPQDGTQAEALAVNADKVILRNANFKSLQDTLLLTGRVYVTNSYVEGNVDFVWGSGVTYFDSCEIKTVGRAGAIVQSRNGANAYGYVFVDSKLTSDPGITGQVLARIDATQYPYSHVAYINCQMSSAIAAKGWTITPTGVSTSNLRFWEYQSTDANGKAINVSGRVSKQISASQAAMMRDKATVLAGWNPQ